MGRASRESSRISGPSATFIAAGLEPPGRERARLTGDRSDMLDRFDAEYGWMYETELEDGRDRADRLHGVVRSDDLPTLRWRVVFFEAGSTLAQARSLRKFNCPTCRAELTKDSLGSAVSDVRTLAGQCSSGSSTCPSNSSIESEDERAGKRFDDRDRAVLDRISWQLPFGLPDRGFTNCGDGPWLAARPKGLHPCRPPLE